MRGISEFAGDELVWIEPALLKAPYELLAGDEVVGSLLWESPSLANGETADQRWTFQREGFWHKRVTIRVPGSDDNVALFHLTWSGVGTLDLDERKLRFRAAKGWNPQWDWEWVDLDDKPLVHFKSHQGLLRADGKIMIEADTNSSPDLSLLIVLGWFLVVQIVRDKADTNPRRL